MLWSHYLKITLSINVPIYWFIFLIANLIYVRNISRITCFESKKLFHNSSNINAKTILIIFNSGNGCWVNYDRIQRQYFNAQTASFTNNTTKYGIFLVGIHSSNCWMCLYNSTINFDGIILILEQLGNIFIVESHERKVKTVYHKGFILRTTSQSK